MKYLFIGNLVPYKAQYQNQKQAAKAWKSGIDFVLESNGHALDGLLVNINLFDGSDNFRLFLQGNKGKFVIVNGEKR